MPAQMESRRAILLTDSSVHSFPGACPIPATVTTTGPVSTDDSSGMAFSVPRLPTLSQWENRLFQYFNYIFNDTSCLPAF